MRYRHAKKLHNEDEVICRHTKRVCRVLSIEVQPRTVLIELLHPVNGYQKVGHREVQ